MTSSFQVIGLCVLAALVLLTVFGRMRRRLSAREGSLWLVLWLSAAIAIVRPGLTITLAQLVGIGRGADLVFYTAILAGGMGFFLIFLRLRRIEEQLTTITRHIALSEAEKKTDHVSEARPPHTGDDPG